MLHALFHRPLAYQQRSQKIAGFGIALISRNCLDECVLRLVGTAQAHVRLAHLSRQTRQFLIGLSRFHQLGEGFVKQGALVIGSARQQMRLSAGHGSKQLGHCSHRILSTALAQVRHRQHI